METELHPQTPVAYENVRRLADYEPWHGMTDAERASDSAARLAARAYHPAFLGRVAPLVTSLIEIDTPSAVILQFPTRA